MEEKREFNELGDMYMTCGIHELIKQYPLFEVQLYLCLKRYKRCDWGDICKEDKKLNDYSLKHGERILAMYEGLGPMQDIKIYIITEWDRSVTTLLLPEEY